MPVAKVIVDVPTMQTNRPFEYEIPTELLAVVEPGVRVEVPFGRGKRQVQGFVLDVTETSDYSGKLKEIVRVIDLNPVLSKEMLEMSSWLADLTYSFQISCLQIMLPNLLRAKYIRSAVPAQGFENDPEVTKLLDNKTSLELNNDIDNSLIEEIQRLLESKKIEILTSVKNRAKQIKRQAIQIKVDKHHLLETEDSLKKNATSQRKLLEFLISNYEKNTFEISSLESMGISRPAIKALQKIKLIDIIEVTKLRKPTDLKNATTQKLELTNEQLNAVKQINNSINQQNAETFLIQGVTGSGKTEIYLQTIDEALKEGRTALMLVPEISLTPQMVNRVSSRFGDQVAVLHSGLSSGERYDEWTRIENGSVNVVVGARSAVFAPLKNLGLIIIDEEHEASYKQDDNPRYNAKDVTQWRSKYHNCPVVLGSATPSLESRARAQKGVYKLIELKRRFNDHDLPEVKIVDMRDSDNAAVSGDISNALKTQLDEILSRKEQAILLLNRRGYSSFLMCRECGFVLKCPNCEVSLTYHKDIQRMKCHYCGHEENVLDECPNCHSDKIGFYGTGTQNVEQQINDMFPDAKTLRMDIDTTSKKGAHAKLLREFESQNADILIGTQMIAKGLDFPNVTLVGVINADTILSLSDYRASERTFQLITQVSGRSGRAEKKGRVIIQTYNPDHYAIKEAAKQDFDSFYKKEMYIRHQGNYTPYYFTTLLSVSHESEGQALKMAYSLKRQLVDSLSEEAIILGPSPTMIARKQNKYYYQIIVKYKHEDNFHKRLLEILSDTQAETKKGFSIAIDNEPQHID
ncbi:primosomal protein N' [Lactobacillus terrae]|uniref:primosomal protein N' n=1 Tax=Lactobacillus terrae TaxID=2269374 RepID=UPI000C1B69DF|nr:primosomal protein N' [Lactobacillus terrae]